MSDLNTQAQRYAAEINAACEAGTLYEYLNDEVCDAEFCTNAERQYKHARLYVAGGGPIAWIDTESGSVIVRSASDRGGWGINTDAWREVDEYAREWYGC